MNEIKEIDISDLQWSNANVKNTPKTKTVEFESLLEHIKRYGLLEPLIVCKNSKGKYEILNGDRRFNAIKELGWKKIPCVIVPTENEDDKKAISLGMNLTHSPITNGEIVRACTDLYEKYSNITFVAQEFGISKYLVKKYVKFARLPQSLKKAIENGEICSDKKEAINFALRAVDLLNWELNNDVSEEEVLKLAKELSKLVSCRMHLGHMCDDSGKIIGDGYEFHGSSYAVIVVGDDKGIFKNNKKMKYKEFEKLPDDFKQNLRLQPRWEDE